MCHVTDIDVYALLPNERDSKHDGELIRVPDPRNRYYIASVRLC